MTNITQELIKSLFNYHDGKLFWKQNRANNKVKSGDRADILHKKSGYFRTCIDSIRYKSHNIIFLYHHGHIPEIVDHIDCDRTNNKIENLRAANKKQNNDNNRIRKDNSSGIKGISIYKDKNCIHAQLQHNGKKYHKHFFPINESNMESAKQWIIEIRKIHHGEFSNHG